MSGDFDTLLSQADGDVRPRAVSLKGLKLRTSGGLKPASLVAPEVASSPGTKAPPPSHQPHTSNSAVANATSTGEEGVTGSACTASSSSVQHAGAEASESRPHLVLPRSGSDDSFATANEFMSQRSAASTMWDEALALSPGSSENPRRPDPAGSAEGAASQRHNSSPDPPTHQLAAAQQLTVLQGDEHADATHAKVSSSIDSDDDMPADVQLLAADSPQVPDDGQSVAPGGQGYDDECGPAEASTGFAMPQLPTSSASAADAEAGADPTAPASHSKTFSSAPHSPPASLSPSPAENLTVSEHSDAELPPSTPAPEAQQPVLDSPKAAQPSQHMLTPGHQHSRSSSEVVGPGDDEYSVVDASELGSYAGSEGTWLEPGGPCFVIIMRSLPRGHDMPMTAFLMQAIVTTLAGQINGAAVLIDRPAVLGGVDPF